MVYDRADLAGLKTSLFRVLSVRFKSYSLSVIGLNYQSQP